MKKKIIFIIFVNLLFFCGLIQIKAAVYEYVQCFYEVGPGIFEPDDSDENTIVEFRTNRGSNQKDWGDTFIVINGMTYDPGSLSTITNENLDSGKLGVFGSDKLGRFFVPLAENPEDYSLMFSEELIKNMKEHMRQGGEIVIYHYI